VHPEPVSVVKLTKKSPARALRAKAAATARARDKTSASTPSQVKSSRAKVKAYRERMRRRGMKLIQVWVPDPSSPHFAVEARRQSRAIAQSPSEKNDQAFIDSITDWNWR
jgi:Protein  of unknown function (DUF3018)